MDKVYKIGLFGGGVVGGGVYDLVTNRLKSKQFQIKSLCVNNINKKRDFHISPDCLITDDPNAILDDPNIDIVIELIGGTSIAGDIITKSIQKGKHVITANKKYISKNLKHIYDLINNNHIYFGYEASVCGGIPIIHSLQRDYSFDTINSISGIFNGSTNYILSRMYFEGESFDKILRDAQRLGYVESDPSDDIEGYDARSKLMIMSRLVYGVELAESDVFSQGISKIKVDDVQICKDNNWVIKLVGSAVVSGNSDSMKNISASLTPTVIDVKQPLASIHMENNIVQVNSDNLGDMVYIGKGAGRYPTANSVVNDLYSILQKPHYSFPPVNNNYKIDTNINSQWYIRFNTIPNYTSLFSGISHKVLSTRDNGITSILTDSKYPMNQLPDESKLTNYFKMPCIF